MFGAWNVKRQHFCDRDIRVEGRKTNFYSVVYDFFGINRRQNICYGGATDATYNTGKNTVRIYDIELQTWSYGTPLPTPTHYAAVATVGDKIYIFGGKSAKTTSTNKVYI